MAVGDTWFESDGLSCNVTLTAAVLKGRVIVVDGWLGIAGSNGAIGETISLIVDDREHRFEVPAALAVAKGATVFVTLADVTGHYPDDTAYVTAAAAGAVAFFKATEAKDANNRVAGIMLAHNALAS